MDEKRLKEVLEAHAEWMRTRFKVKPKGCMADLCRANLRMANLYGADLRRADLRMADLCEAIGIHLACPEVGEFIGFKKAIAEDCGYLARVIVELRVLEDAKRSSATGRKCRCDKAKVLSITSLDGDKKYQSAFSIWDDTFIYNVGDIVSVDDFDKNRWQECAQGIHFFITRREAVDY